MISSGQSGAWTSCRSDMRKRLGGQICALLFVIGTIVSAQTDSATIGKAEAVLKNLQDGRYAEVVKEFNPAMEKAIPEERLRAVWEMLTAQFGSVKSIDERRSGELKGYRAVELIAGLRKRAGRAEGGVRRRRQDRRAGIPACEHGACCPARRSDEAEP